VTLSTCQTASFGAATTTGVAPGPQATTDPVEAAFLASLRKHRAPVWEVHVSFDGPYLFYTVVESNSPAALDKVYRAERETQRQFWGPEPRPKIPIVFEHRNRTLGGQELEEDFLSRGQFIRVW
jgi:hypothetical protein